MNVLHCDKIEVTEWYDGLVQGFIYYSENIFYAILLAWDVDLAQRIYLIIPLEVGFKNVISAAYTDPGAWPVASQLIREIIQRQDCYFSFDFPEKNVDLHLSPASNLSNSGLRFEKFMLDQAITRQSIDKWLNK